MVSQRNLHRMTASVCARSEATGSSFPHFVTDASGLVSAAEESVFSKDSSRALTNSPSAQTTETEGSNKTSVFLVAPDSAEPNRAL